MRLSRSAVLLRLAIVVSLALPGTVLSRSHKELAIEEVHSQAGVFGMMLRAHSGGWATGAVEDEMFSGGGALRRLTQARHKRLPGTGCANLIM